MAKKRKKRRRRVPTGIGFHRRTRPGASPGTVKADPQAPAPIISLIAFGPEQLEDCRLDSPEQIRLLGRRAVHRDVGEQRRVQLTQVFSELPTACQQGFNVGMVGHGNLLFVAGVGGCGQDGVRPAAVPACGRTDLAEGPRRGDGIGDRGQRRRWGVYAARLDVHGHVDDNLWMSTSRW